MRNKRKWDVEILVKYSLLALLTPLMMVFAYQERGYMAYGGELLILPLVFLSRYFFKLVKEMVEYE